MSELRKLRDDLDEVDEKHETAVKELARITHDHLVRMQKEIDDLKRRVAELER